MSPYLYVPGDSLLHRLDPRTKLLALVAVLLVAVAAASPGVLAGLLVLLLGLAVASRTGPALRRVRFLAVTVLLFPPVLWSLVGVGRADGWGAGAGEAGLFGLAAGLRLCSMVIASALFLATTRNEELVAGLLRWGLPYPFAFALSAALRLVPTFVASAVAVAEAQRARGHDLDAGNPLQRMRKHLPLVVPCWRVRCGRPTSSPWPWRPAASGRGRGAPSTWSCATARPTGSAPSSRWWRSWRRSMGSSGAAVRWTEGRPQDREGPGTGGDPAAQPVPRPEGGRWR
ncbi:MULTISPECIES: energy-coupling factor transporter transmembrane component T family protein [Thermaerobacter]|uniref:Energy-coupling factor transporter transmembrane component T n=1 Tax=Thermaerobacter composti TaxID=554949 RepID=A0ABZ0QNP7_9FIRM|nr:MULTISPECIES: energy-coupling factor transporter transmembrane component T [Thermaerobacter]WPD18050.1 energy-coupling factor transporter transmembrane component T [Thermaerobacter composti]